MQTSVLDMVRGHLFLAFDLHTDVQPDGTRYSRFVSPLVWKTEMDGCSRTFQHSLGYFNVCMTVALLDSLRLRPGYLLRLVL